MLALVLAVILNLTANASALPSCRQEWRGEDSTYNFKEKYSNFYKNLNREKCEKDWTILVYMAADNDLFPFALLDLYEMEAAFESGKGAGSTLKTDLIVQADGPESNDLRRIHIYSGPVKYSQKSREDFDREKLDSVSSPIIEKMSEKKDSEKKRLSDFISWGAKKYPAKNFMVIVWGHGQGWKSFPVKNPVKSRFLKESDLPNFPDSETDSKFGGIGFRKSSNSWLDIPGLKSALNSFEKTTGKPVDVYASDACLMQMLEVSYELSDTARFIVGTTQVQNFLGLPYRRLMYELNTGHFNGMRKKNSGEDAKDEPYLLAKMIPALMKQSLDPRRGSQGRGDIESQKFVTSSALTSTELRRLLIPEIKKLGASLKEFLKEDPMRALDLQFVMQMAPAFEGSAQDFGVFLGLIDLLILEEKDKLGSMSPGAKKLSDSIRNSKEVLDETILAYAYGSAYPQDKASVVGFIPRAVSLWLPASPEEYSLRKKEFMDSEFYKATGWQDWLDLIYP